MDGSNSTELENWKQFVLTYGWRAPAYELGAVLGQTPEAVQKVRDTGACKRLATHKRFSELFTLWHGRLPTEAEWPKPRFFHDAYEWQLPELALLASLVGQFSCKEIAPILTQRLRKVTGDTGAARTRISVQNHISAIGMQSKDVLGGIVASDAGREIGSYAIVHQAIENKTLAARRVGRLLVISREAWTEWKAKRNYPPDGYVALSTFRKALSIQSDKLSEFARMGYVPGAMLCTNPIGSEAGTSSRGAWYIETKVGEQMLADRRAGRPMPWHGKPLMDNLRATYKLWAQRKHPDSCEVCKAIWGETGAPADFNDYVKRYPPLAHGAKRHLTRPWTPGVTVAEVAKQAGCEQDLVSRAIANGVLAATRHEGIQFITQTDATRWIARHCPAGDGDKSWISLETACRQYLFSIQELREHMAAARLNSKVGTAGARRGIEYVPRQQCAQLREQIGFTEEDAALRVGVSVTEFRGLLEGVNWRGAEGIPLVTVQAVIKRRQSRQGYSIEDAAKLLGTSEQWIADRKDDGTIKMKCTEWDGDRQYITGPMLERLRKALKSPVVREHWSADWLRLSEAAREAGVTTATILKWTDLGELGRLQSIRGWRYYRAHVRARARVYWQTVRFHRATPPAWLAAERDASTLRLRHLSEKET